MSENKIGYTTVTYKLRLYNRHRNWIRNTKQLYNLVVKHYYKILIKETRLLEQGNFFILRALEELSIGTKEMKAKGEEPKWKLFDIPKIPLYFRRAAINTAIGLVRNKAKLEWSLLQTEKIDCSPVFYKGMYRKLQEGSIQLKLYNGKKWVWREYPFTGRRLPPKGKILSPTLKVEKEADYLHIPVEIEVEDIRTVKERMEAGEIICAVSFPDSDTLAVCAKMKQDGKVIESFFIHGGRKREAQRREVLKRLEKSKQSRQGRKKEQEDKKKSNDFGENEQENAALYRRLKQINSYYSQKVSREILDYCIKGQIKVIVVPNYENTISFTECRYLSTNSFRWQGRSIIRNLKDKAFREGILVSTVRPYHISDCCSECGAKIWRYNEGHKVSRNYYGGQLFLCPNGHKGNAAWNTAKNVGRYFLRYYQKEPEDMDRILTREYIRMLENKDFGELG